ncbi:MAG: YebC/PmpR family DNA-binding transcriptional regulator [Candidatus Doudnabacteria bacterium]|nr:YebC/PmpR family DNA-binding transcriptional regulator [Candidatus Doudnabacteria bacterium]
MSGHSKWATIKRQKAVTDAKRGQAFTKLGRNITIAVKEGGGPDPSFNFKLRMAVDRAKDAGMPADNIDRAIKRGSGEGKEALETVVYEGYGPFGTAFLIEAVTDNPNRTTSNIKHIFGSYDGNLGTKGSVAWQFNTKGQILIERDREDLADLELKAIDAGAEDVRESEEGLEVYTLPMDLQKIKDSMLKAGAKIAKADVIQESSQGVNLTEDQKVKVNRLFEELENDDDVIAVHTSANL